ncbi:MAG TPA: DUF445 domain-containing protein [Mycobacteriales bacterium]|nr:DUF445 domain-containing protein [Mycobacteriales bacterium]
MDVPGRRARHRARRYQALDRRQAPDGGHLSTGTGVPGPAAPGVADSDDIRRNRLRRMKAVATGLLVVAAAVYAATYQVDGGGTGGWGYLRAAAEAAMVGGVADWFAVTALFRHPLGLPIPHTALIPRRKDSLGRSLQSFIGENFLTPAALSSQLQDADIAGRAGRWLADPGHAARVAKEGADAAAAALRLLRDGDLRDLAMHLLQARLALASPAAPVGRTLDALVRAGGHRAALDRAITGLHHWLVIAADDVIALLERAAPAWSPAFVDRPVARRLHRELTRVLAEIEADPDHPLRARVDDFLLQLAHDLSHDPKVARGFDQAVHRLATRPAVRAAVGDLLTSGREQLAAALSEPASSLHRRLAENVREVGMRLQADAGWHSSFEDAVIRAGTYLAMHYRDDLTRIIADTVSRWDGPQAARRIELHVGRDLQFIRINGAVVGALAGLLIHAVTSLVG